MTTRIIATAPLVTGQGHRLERGDLIAECERPLDANLLGDLAQFTVVNVAGGFQLRQENQFGETVNVEFASPLDPPIEAGTLAAMWRTGLAKIEEAEVDEPDQDPDQDPDEPPSDEQELPPPGPDWPTGKGTKPKAPRKPKS